MNRKYREWRSILRQDYDKVVFYYDSISASEKYVCALYFAAEFEDWVDDKLSPHIHVFDWDGNFLADISVSERIKVISFGESPDILYGLDVEDNIFRYELPPLDSH